MRKAMSPRAAELLTVLSFLSTAAAAADLPPSDPGNRAFAECSLTQTPGDLRYSKRGNRCEGTRELPISSAPSLEVLSFSRGSRSILPAANGEITLSFYLPAGAASSAGIEARELVADRLYEMRPTRTSWPPGWNSFAPWPARDVLQPLGVRLDNLGVLASSPAGTLAELVAVVPAGLASAGSRDTYYLLFRTRDDLRKADWSVRDTAGAQQPRGGSLRDIAGGTPTAIRFDLRGLAEGYYRIYLDCRYEGRSSGPAGEYRFYHRVAGPTSPGGNP